MKGSPAKGPQWIQAMLGEWLNGWKGLAGKLGGGVVGSVGRPIELKGGCVLEASCCLLNWISCALTRLTNPRPPPNQFLRGYKLCVCVCACLLGLGEYRYVWGGWRLLPWRNKKTVEETTTVIPWPIIVTSISRPLSVCIHCWWSATQFQSKTTEIWCCHREPALTPPIPPTQTEYSFMRLIQSDQETEKCCFDIVQMNW